jgi:hypothetical protein
MIGNESHKYEVAQTVADFLATDQELLQTFRHFRISEVSFDESPQSFYCGWVMSIMGTAFYRRWNAIREQIARSYEFQQHEDWATISALAHELVSDNL